MLTACWPSISVLFKTRHCPCCCPAPPSHCARTRLACCALPGHHGREHRVPCTMKGIFKGKMAKGKTSLPGLPRRRRGKGGHGCVASFAGPRGIILRLRKERRGRGREEEERKGGGLHPFQEPDCRSSLCLSLKPTEQVVSTYSCGPHNI